RPALSDRSAGRVRTRARPTRALSPYTTLFRSYHFSETRPGRFGWDPLFAAESLLRRSLLQVVHWPEQPLFSVGSALQTDPDLPRSEEHTSELQSRENLVCRLLLEKKKPGTGYT